MCNCFSINLYIYITLFLIFTVKIFYFQECINVIHIGTLDSFGNHIKGNCTFVAFNTDGGQGKVIEYFL